MSVEKGLVSLLGGSPSVCGGRIYARLPQNPTFPLVRYQRIATERTSSVDAQNVGPTMFTVQIDAMARSYEQAKEAASSVFERLNNYNGPWGSSQCRFCKIQTENDDYNQDGDEITHWVTQRYQIWTSDQ